MKKKKDKIIFYKNEYKENKLLEDIKKTKNYISFKDKIKKNFFEKKISIIAEIKKSSPSAGEIVKNYDPINIAKIYIENGASCISVLTEEDFFLGKLEHISSIKKKYTIPILCKDFFIDTYQATLAKSFGADCILIILSSVDKVLARDLYQAASALKMSTLIEVHTEKEAEIALSFDDALIGINNRNLKTFNVSLETSIKLSKILSSHKNPLISESGINSIEDIKFIIENAKINNFLIGESLLKSSDIGSKLTQLTQINL